MSLGIMFWMLLRLIISHSRVLSCVDDDGRDLVFSSEGFVGALVVVVWYPLD